MIICFASVSWWFFFGFLWLFALLVFHDDLLSHWPFLPQPRLTFQSPKLITMEWIAGCLTLAILIHKHMVSGNESISWGLSHTTCMLSIEVSYFYSISMKLETIPSFSYFWYSIFLKVSKTSLMVSDISRLKINKAISTNWLISDLGRKLKLEIRDWLNT